MKDIRISDHGNWRHMHWNALVSNYRNSPFFEYYADDFRPFYEKKYTFLWDYNQEICELVCSLIDIHPLMEGTNEYRTEFLNDEMDYREVIHPKKDYRIADPSFVAEPYYQVFKEKFGVSLTEYIMQKRLERAAELLEDSALPIEEIGFKVGFGDRSSFYHAFVRRYGIAPQQFRKKAQM
jgi:AraC-like DNA-binding protein